MDNFLYVHICRSTYGLTNQIISLVWGLVNCINSGKKGIFVDRFRCDIMQDTFVPTSSIIDFKRTNNYLYSKYNICIFDANNYNFKINTVLYGSFTFSIDITDEFKKKYMINNKLIIEKNSDLNEFGDPHKSVVKTLKIIYSIDDYIFRADIDENRVNDIIFDPLNNIYNDYLTGYVNYCVNMKYLFDDIFKNIYFNEYFENISNNFIKEILSTSNLLNCVHLRTENDMCEHMKRCSDQFPKDMGKEQIQNKYIELIKKYINKDEMTIILCSEIDKEIFDFLTNNEYKFVFTKKYSLYREINAITDFLISKNCNNIFIGTLSSTFSQNILTNLNEKKIKKIVFNFNEITKDEIIWS